MTSIDLITAKPRPPRFGGGANWGRQLRIGLLIDAMDARGHDTKVLRKHLRDPIVLAAAALSGRLDRELRAGELAFTGHNDHALEYSVRYHAQVAAHLMEDELATGLEVYTALLASAPGCASALVNLAELARRRGDLATTIELLDAALALSTTSLARRHGIADSAWETTIRCDRARVLGDVQSPLLAHVLPERLDELVAALRACGSWEAAAVPAHGAFGAAAPAQRIVLHAAMRLAPIHPQPPPAAHDSFAAVDDVERLVGDHTKRKR